MEVSIQLPIEELVDALFAKFFLIPSISLLVNWFGSNLNNNIELEMEVSIQLPM